MSDTEVYVGLTINGGFDPASVTERLRIEPTRTRSKGQFVGKRTGKVADTSHWSVDSAASTDADTIEPHLQWLLELIEPQAAALAAVVAEGAFAYADCFWSSPGLSGGPWITPESMARLAALKLPLIISFYGSSTEDPANT
jgi:hypothetical protein